MGLILHFKTMNCFVYEKPDHQPASFTILNFEVDDIDGAIDDLVKAGVKFEMYDNLPAKQDAKGVLRNEPYNPEYGPKAIAWFKDPSDNVLALIQK